MLLNRDKTYNIIFGARKTVPPVMPIIDTPIIFVDNLKLLGITFDSKLNWSRHIDTIISKQAQRLYFLRQAKKVNYNHKDLFTIYRAFIQSIADYGSEILLGLSRFQN